MPRRRNSIAAALLLLLVVGAFVGFLSSGTDDSTDSLGAGGVNADAVANDVADTAAGESRVDNALTAGGSGTGAAAGAPAPTGSEPQIVKNAVLRLEIGKDGFRKAFESASRVAGAHGGFVVSSESSTEADAASHGAFVLRVPAASFDAARADLSALGTVKDERITGQDVGGQLVDLDARIRSLQAQEDVLRSLMAKAKTIGETIDVQNHLTQVRQQIEQLSGEKARLADAAALATIRAELFEPGGAAKADEPEASPLRQAVTRAVDGAETVVAGTVIVLGWAVPLALLAGAGWLAARPFRRRLAPAQDPS